MPGIAPSISFAFSKWVKGVFPTVLGVIGGILVWRLWHFPPPWKVPGANRLQEGAKSQLAYFIPVGLWWGSLIALVLVLTAFAIWLWCRRRPAPAVHPALAGTTGHPLPRWLWLALMVVTLASLPQRWERLHHSFWGDEARAFPSYVHGRWVPPKGGDFQGPLRFVQVSWTQTLFGDNMGGGGNNHYLLSVLTRFGHETWQKFAHKHVGEFSEPAARWPALVAGLLLPWVLAWMLARRGMPVVGLIAAVLLTLHPWHLRFSTEHRGYTLVALFLLLTVEAMAYAIARGRWRDWAVLACCEFLALYSWKAAAFPILLMNGWLVVLLLRAWRQGHLAPADLLSTLGRRAVGGLLAAALFIQLYLPCHLQINYLRAKGQLVGLPMDERWLRETVAEFFTGVQWHLQQPEFTGEYSIERLAQHHLLSLVLYAVLAATFIIAGVVRLWRWDRAWTGVLGAVAAGLGLAALCFKFVFEGMEFLDWYFFAAVPVIIGCAAVGMWSLARRLHSNVAWAAALVFVGGYAWATHWGRDTLLQRPRQDFAGASKLTRHDWSPASMKKSTRIHTVYMHQSAPGYDPRALRDVSDPAALRKIALNARRMGGEFFVVIAHLGRCREIFSKTTALVENEELFDLKEVLWGQDERQTLRVYNWRGTDF